MFKNNNPQFFYHNNAKLFFNTNFNLDDYNNKRPLIVFNYGLICNFAHFKFQYEYFEKNHYQMLIHNYRNHFSSTSSISYDKISFTLLAEDITKLLDSFNAKNIIHIGHSMGVNVVLECIKNFHHNIIGSVLISGSILPPHEVMFNSNIIDIIAPSIHAISKKYPNIFNKIWKTNYLNPIAQKIIHEGGFNKDKVSKDFITHYLKKIGELEPDLFLHLIEAMKEHEIAYDLEKMSCPSLIIGGEKDKVIPNYLQYMLHERLKLSEIYIVKDGSHVPQVDFPETINERIRIFIDKITL